MVDIAASTITGNGATKLPVLGFVSGISLRALTESGEKSNGRPERHRHSDRRSHHT